MLRAMGIENRALLYMNHTKQLWDVIYERLQSVATSIGYRAGNSPGVAQVGLGFHSV